MFTSLRAISVAAAVAVAAVAVPTLTSAQTDGSRDITVREKVRAVKFVHAGASSRGERLAMGDHVLTRQALSDDKGRRARGALHRLRQCRPPGGGVQGNAAVHL